MKMAKRYVPFHEAGALHPGCVLALLMLIFSPACANQAQVSKPVSKAFPVRAMHLTLRPQILSITQYRRKIDQAAALHYNMLILHTGGIYAAAYQVPKPGQIKFNNATHEQIAQLLVYARKAGLEPVFEVKVISKHASIISKALLKKHPGLVTKSIQKWRNGILNPAYRFADGRDAYDVIEMPMLDNFIALYGKTKPRYLLLGTDEAPVDDLASCAKALNTTTPKLYASLINRCVDHLLAKGITPIMWGDMFLSGKLGKPGHGIKGFKADPRIISGHASFLNNSPDAPSTLTAMNDLKNRDKIIMADWHYGPGGHGEYPSVDYFQAMGFKDVWGTTWYNEHGIAQFSRYAAQRGCGGMISTSWHMSFSPSVIHNFKPLVNNSSLYFRNPMYTPFQNPIVSFRLAAPGKSAFPATEKSGGIFPKATRTLSYVVTLNPKIQPRQAVVMIRDDQTDSLTWTSFPLQFDAKTHRLTGNVQLPSKLGKLPHPYSLLVRFLDQHGYMAQRFDVRYFQIMDQQPAVAGKARPDAFIALDFSGLTRSDLNAKLFYATGQFPALMQIVRATNKPMASTEPLASGVLDCRHEVAWSQIPGLWKQIAQRGMRMEITFKLTSEMMAHKKNYAALLSLGTYNSGMRFLMTRERTLLLQFAGQAPDRLPIWITTPEKIKRNQWHTVRVTLTPETAGKKRQATLQLNQSEKVVAVLPHPVVQTNGDAPLGLGVEFTRFSNNRNRAWPPLPGLIRSVVIRPY